MLGNVKRQQPGRVANWCRLQNEPADHGENRCIGADTQPDRKDRHQGHRRIFGQRSHGIAKIVPYVFQPWQGAAFAPGLAYLLHPPQLQQCSSPGFIGAQARANPIFHLHCEVGLEFRGEVFIRLRCPPNPRES